MARIAVGMSGGTDSAGAALLLKKAGYTPVGVTLLLSGNENVSGAGAICDALRMEFHIIDMREAFREKVISPFIGEYRRGRTPNPCVLCNREIKFGRFFDVARTLNCEKVATGHYAKTEYFDGAWHLLAGSDSAKDQSYFLWTLDQEKLSRILFPLADTTKPEIRKLVQEAGLPVESRESQDICFIPDGDCGGYLDREGGSPVPGAIVRPDGTVLGTHCGITHYTVGQRKGLGISSAQPLYVIEKSPETNTVVLGEESLLYRQTVYISGLHFISGRLPDAPVAVEARLRYTRHSAAAVLTCTGNGEGMLEFSQPQRAPAPGQSAVFFRGDEILGGGFLA